jgi:hypothetical protein
LYALLAVIVVVAVAIAVARVEASPHTVRGVVVRNTTPYEMTIVVSSTPSGDVTPLGIVPLRRTETFSEVIDEGPTWYFHLACSGVDAGTIVRTESALEGAGWQVDIGGDAATRCRDAGLAPDAS